MANKVKITNQQGTQVFPITHVSAVIDSNGNSIEQILNAQIELIQQAQMEIGAVPSDMKPIDGSSNWVLSGSIYNELYSQVELSSTELTDIIINATTDKWYSANGAVAYMYFVPTGVTVSIKSNDSLGYAIAFLSSNTHTADTTPDYITGYNGVIIGTAGQSDSYTPGVECWMYVLDKAHGTASSRLPASIGAGANKIEVIDNSLYKHDTSTALSPVFLQGQYQQVNNEYGVFMAIDTRVSFVPIPIAAGDSVTCEIESGLMYNVVYFDKDGNFDHDCTLWSINSPFVIDNWTGSFSINIRNTADTSLPVASFSGLTMTIKKGIGIEGIVGNLENKLTDVITSLQSHEYKGERVDLMSKTFDIKLKIRLNTPNSYDLVQSVAVSGDYIVLGRAKEENGSTAYLLYKNRGYITKLLLPHIGYDAIHANTTCFGEDSQYTIPLLYCSQWDGQRACFVYEIDNSYNVTLKRVIDPANLSSSVFGAGQADWIVGDGYLYSIAYILNSPYPATGNGLRVCKFNLPTGSGVINLADSDVIESYDIEPCFIRQDSCYYNGKIYMLFGGSTSSGYANYRRMMVLDVMKKKVVTICDMQWASSEPECIDVIDDGLYIMFNSVSGGIYKMVFD